MYTRLLSVLRETLLPLGFTERQADIQASVTQRTIFEKGSEQIILYNDLRERDYTLMTGNTGQTSEQGGLPHPILFGCSVLDFDEGKVFSFRDALESWLKKIT